MASVTVQYTWPEGGCLTVIVDGKPTYPDALSQMRTEARRLWADALAALEPATDGDG